MSSLQLLTLWGGPRRPRLYCHKLIMHDRTELSVLGPVVYQDKNEGITVI